jgi:hypothetical protein
MSARGLAERGAGEKLLRAGKCPPRWNKIPPKRENRVRKVSTPANITNIIVDIIYGNNQYSVSQTKRVGRIVPERHPNKGDCHDFTSSDTGAFRRCGSDCFSACHQARTPSSAGLLRSGSPTRASRSAGPSSHQDRRCSKRLARPRSISARRATFRRSLHRRPAVTSTMSAPTAAARRARRSWSATTPRSRRWKT